MEQAVLELDNLPFEIHVDEPIGPVEPKPLRQYQIACVAAVVEALDRGLYRVMFEVVAGGGKTRILADLIDRYLQPRRPILFIAHTEELLDQAKEAILENNPTLNVGIERAEFHAHYNSDVIVASVQTIGALARITPQRRQEIKAAHLEAAKLESLANKTADDATRLQLIEQALEIREQAVPPDTDRLQWLADVGPALIICDEFHHSAADSYIRTFKRFGAFDGRSKLVGCTATPKRFDKKPLPAEEIVYRYTIKEATNGPEPVLVAKKRGWRIKTGLDLSAIRTSGEDFNISDLDKLVNTNATNGIMFDAWERIAKDRKTLVFCTSIDQVETMHAMFLEAGYKAAMVTGNTEKHLRQQLIADYRANRSQVMINYGVFTEGFNVTDISCILNLRPTESPGLYVQMVSRAFRLHEGKQDCIARGQLILTDQGLVQIEQVTLQMKVWDGCEFVSHSGAICRGEQEVITYAGLTGTPDHKVWTQKGWKTLRECRAMDIPVSVTGIGRQAVRESQGTYRRNNSKRFQKSPVHMGGVRMRKTVSEGLLQSYLSTTGLQELRQSNKCASLASDPCNWRKAKMHQSKRLTIRTIWGTRNRVSVCKSYCHGSICSGTFRSTSRMANRQNRQRRPLRTRQFAISHDPTELLQYTQTKTYSRNARFQRSSPRSAICRHYIDKIYRRRVELGRDRKAVQPTIIQTKRQVWDILNAGPRHRFTAEGLLVSNCVIIEGGFDAGKHTLCSLVTILGLPAGLDLEGEPLERAAEILERMGPIAAKIPEVQPTTLRELENMLEQVELLSNLEPSPEIRKASKYNWLNMMDGLLLECGNKRKAYVRSDELGAYHVRLVQDKAVWYFDTPAENTAHALKAADGIITQVFGPIPTYMAKNAKWMKKPVSDKQRAILHRFKNSRGERMYNDTFISALDMGKAAAIITKHFNK